MRAIQANAGVIRAAFHPDMALVQLDQELIALWGCVVVGSLVTSINNIAWAQWFFFCGVVEFYPDIPALVPLRVESVKYLAGIISLRVCYYI